MKIIYEKHPMTPERKSELRGRGYKILDAMFAPEGYEHPDSETKNGADQSSLNESQTEGSSTSTPSQESGEGKVDDDGLDELDVDQLREIAKERGVSVHYKAGADKVREALRAAKQESGEG